MYVKMNVKVLIFKFKVNEKMIFKGLVFDMYELKGFLIKNFLFCWNWLSGIGKEIKNVLYKLKYGCIEEW